MTARTHRAFDARMSTPPPLATARLPVGAPLLSVALWMSGAIGAFSTMAIAGREAGLTLDTFEIMLFRSLTGIVLVLVIGGRAGTLGQVRTARLPLHLVRNAAHFTGQNLWFFALGLIPLAQLFALEFTSPLWVVLLAPLLIGERLTRRRLAATAVGFAGSGSSPAPISRT